MTRGMQVKSLLDQGFCVKQVADELGISEWAVAHEMEMIGWGRCITVPGTQSLIGCLDGPSSCPAIHFSV